MLFFRLIQLKDDDKIANSLPPHSNQSFALLNNASEQGTLSSGTQEKSGVNVIRKTPSNRKKSSLSGVGSSDYSFHSQHIPLVECFSQAPDPELLYQRVLVFLPYTSALKFSFVSRNFNQLAKKHSPYIFSMSQFVQWYHQVCVVMLNNNGAGGAIQLKQHQFLRAVQVISRSCRIQLLVNELFHKSNTSVALADQDETPEVPPVGIYMCIPLSSRVEFAKKQKMVSTLIDTISLQNVYYQEMCTFLLGKLQIIEFEQIKGEENAGFVSVIQIIPDLQQIEHKVFIHQNLMVTTLQLQGQQPRKKVTLYQMSIGTNSPKYASFLGLPSDIGANERLVIVSMAGSKYEFNDVILYKLCQLSGVITNTTTMSVIEMFQFLAMCGTLDTCQQVIEQYYNYKRNNLQTFSLTPARFEHTPRDTDNDVRSLDFVATTFLKQYVFDLTNIKSTKIYLLDLLINMTNQLLCDIQFVDLPRRLLNYTTKKQEYDSVIGTVSNIFGREVRYKLLGTTVECSNYSMLRMTLPPSATNKVLESSGRYSCEFVFNFMGFNSLRYIGSDQEKSLRMTIKTSNKKLAAYIGIKEDRDVLILNNQTVNMRILKYLTELLQVDWSEQEMLFFLATCCSSTAKSLFTDSAKTAYVENEWVSTQKEHTFLYYVSEQLSRILQCKNLVNTDV